ncbi:hypothetical protein C8R47DRAFT_1201406, partial [Mycena vitilis]
LLLAFSSCLAGVLLTPRLFFLVHFTHERTPQHIGRGVRRTAGTTQVVAAYKCVISQAGVRLPASEISTKAALLFHSSTSTSTY